MTASSISNLWWNSLRILLLLLVFQPSPTWGATTKKRSSDSRVKTQYRMNISLREAVSTYGKKELISNRARWEGETKAVFSPYLQAVAGARLSFETAYSQNSMSYSDTLLASPFYEATLRDTYLSMKKGGTSLRAGYQTVVWGEAFGNFYTDILNPKDFRELWLNDLAEHEISVPMVNAQFTRSAFNLQLIYLPKPSFNRIPNPDSPYSPTWNSLSLLPSGGALNIQTDDSPSWFQVNEWAGRLNAQLGSWDLSIFGFWGLDRNPHYQVLSLGPQSVLIGERHSRISAQGVTASADLDGSILRFESVLVKERKMNVTSLSGLQSLASDNLITVIGYDLPGSPSWSLGLQATADLLFQRSENYLFREDLRNTLGSRFWWEFLGENQFEMITSVRVTAWGALLQPRFIHPLSRSLELRWGADLFFGEQGSEYDLLRGSSRAWIRLTGYFNG